VSFAGLAKSAAALVLGAAMLVAANYAVAGRLVWTPGGAAIAFGRMLQTGIVARYLDDHCPDPRLKLCDHRAELPTDADVFFWGESVFDRLGRFEGMNDEMRTIVLESIADYPWLQIKAAISGTIEQLFSIGTGYGVNTEIWHTYGMIERFVPSAVPAMRAARQQHNEIDFATINRLHQPIAWLSMVLLFVFLAAALARRRFGDLEWLGATVALAILANAFVCGALSNPHDRYGARAVWLATFVLLLVALQHWKTARREKSRKTPSFPDWRADFARKSRFAVHRRGPIATGGGICTVDSARLAIPNCRDGRPRLNFARSQSFLLIGGLGARKAPGFASGLSFWLTAPPTFFPRARRGLSLISGGDHLSFRRTAAMVLTAAP
jgi:hypothetical protein